MLKAYKFRIYPTKSQRTKMEQTLDLCRWTYNKTLEIRKNAWENEGKSLSKYETNNLLPEWKADKPELKDVFSQVLQNVHERVDLALKAFLRRVKAGEKPGYPRFRGRGRYDSFTYPQKGFKIDSGKLYLSKIGNIKINLHRPIEGKIKRLTVRRAATGKWYACFSVEIEDQPKPPWKDGTLVGIDVGLESFATLSNGEKISNPRFFREEEHELARAQRKLSKAPKGTPDRKKALKVVERVHERIANKRYEFAHQISNDLVKRFGLIAFEDLNIKGMTKNHCLAKSIHDVAWNMLVTLTSYKAERAGSMVVLVDPRNTSKMCSRCGILVQKDLSERFHNCTQCGLSVDRDWNAAINILRLGLQSVGIKTVEACPF
ncbi:MULTISPECIES: transposase [unclassified Methanothrix]|jgi:putative transposase|nr:MULTISPECIES: transposase [unclassified Methanothrix]MBP7067829.1 transposase [Methanothrix sp.]UEC40249.1 MAG: transposase [Methanothrix sp.]